MSIIDELHLDKNKRLNPLNVLLKPLHFMTIESISDLTSSLQEQHDSCHQYLHAVTKNATVEIDMQGLFQSGQVR
jgi:hypothetical protein